MADSFDKIIKNTLNSNERTVKGQKYKIPGTASKGGTLTIDKKDVESFKKLFTKKPNSGVGNGEVSLYWLFNYTTKAQKLSEAMKPAKENRGGDAADLTINGKAVEVKSYPKHSQMTLGKFKDDRESLELFNYLFSFINLFIQFGTSTKKDRAFKSVLGFNTDDVVQGLGYYDVLYEVFTTPKVQKKIAALEAAGLEGTQQAKRAAMAKEKELSAFAKQLIKLNIVSNAPKGFTDSPKKRNDLAAQIVGYFLKTKLARKPSDGGYMVNLLTTDATDIHFHLVRLKQMKLNYATLQKGFNVASGEIQITKANEIFK